MNSANDFQWIVEGPEGAVAFWQAYSPEARVNLSASAVRLGERLVFIDPIPLEEPALKRLVGRNSPAAIFLTNGNHQRAAVAFAERFRIPIQAHVSALPELTVPVDDPVGEGAFLFDALAATALPGGAAGETALHWPALGGVLFVGDAVINLPETGLIPLPEKYCLDAGQLRDSLRRLPTIPFGTALFAHGEPIVGNARERFEALAAGL